MNKIKTNEGGEASNNIEEVLVVVDSSSMKVAQNLSEEEEERTSLYFGRMQHYFSSFHAMSRDEHLFLFTRVYFSSLTCFTTLLNNFDNKSKIKEKICWAWLKINKIIFDKSLYYPIKWVSARGYSHLVGIWITSRFYLVFYFEYQLMWWNITFCSTLSCLKTANTQIGGILSLKKSWLWRRIRVRYPEDTRFEKSSNVNTIKLV